MMRSTLAALALAACAHAPLPAPPPAAEAPAATAGQISSVDPYERLVKVNTPKGDLELRATDDSELISDTGVGWMPMSDLRPGDDVRVAWRFRPDGTRELTSLRVLPRKGELPETEPLPPPRDDDTPILPPAGGLSPLPIGGR
ncbi:MAG TPA: hypothetical protein VMB50_02280 [Myxococcales bacterium]|nr:hypothetical protein [Myxococcales bacterium]